ncbi:hypothetical protein BH24ACI5_BH24ACI5_26800 [soil metagenome]
MKIVLAALILALCATGFQQAPPTSEPQGAPADITRLAWLAGSWTGTAGRSTIEEHWTPPAGGSMLAVARTIREDRLRAFEFLRIVQKGTTLVYLAMPNGRAPATEFTLTKVEADSVTFYRKAALKDCATETLT